MFNFDCQNFTNGKLYCQKTWSKLHSLSSSSNHGDYSAICTTHYGLYLVMCYPFIILSLSFWPFLYYFSPFRLLLSWIFLNIVINTWYFFMISSFLSSHLLHLFHHFFIFCHLFTHPLNSH